MLVAIGYVASSIYADASAAGVHATAILPFALLFIALLVALGFEFVNGFHDTANAVATVIYTNSMPAQVAVVWSGFFNFLGVLLSTGAVAFSIVSLLPVELILQVGSDAGFAMVFALLIAAIIWNLATWLFGIPNSVLAHADRIDHRRRRRQCAAPRPQRHGGRRMGAGDHDRRVAAAVAAARLLRLGAAVLRRQAADQEQGAVRGAQGRLAAADRGSAAC